MKATSHFLQMTILGGAFFLMPIVVLAYLFNKAFDFARRALKPAPGDSAFRPTSRRATLPLFSSRIHPTHFPARSSSSPVTGSNSWMCRSRGLSAVWSGAA
jgi:hypothetical protein